MKTILITGATSGIGLYIARQLSSEGYDVYGTSRNPERYEGTLPFELLRLDVNSDDSVSQCVATLVSKTGSIDVLINNAGIGICGSAEETSMEQARRQFETNYWGVVKMTRAVLPHMRKQRSGHIITVGSLAGLIGVPFQGYYSASKHALEGFFKSLKLEVGSFGIHISVVEPGFFRTNLHRDFEYAAPSIGDYDGLRKNALGFLTSSIEKAKTPEPVARIILKTIRSGRPAFSYPVGKNTRLAPLMQFLFSGLYEIVMRKRFGLS